MRSGSPAHPWHGASCSAGFTKAETERIWLFLVPLACVAAAPAITSRRTMAVIAVLLAQALAIEVLFDTIW